MQRNRLNILNLSDEKNALFNIIKKIFFYTQNLKSMVIKSSSYVLIKP